MSNAKNSKISRIRLALLVAAIIIFWIVLEVNLFRLQVVNKDLFSNVARWQYEKKITLAARRGAIVDRNGNILATTTLHYDIAADPKMIADKELIARQCARAFNKPVNYYREKLGRDAHFVFLERKADERKVKEILDIRDPGLIKTENFRRSYPYKTYAAHLLGFTDPDGKGLSGIELMFDDLLKGAEGEAVLQYDGPRRVFYNADYPLRKAETGSDIFLTIDKNIQTVVEQELAAGVKKENAASAVAIVLDPYSGAILAMVNYPTFDPNRHNSYKPSGKRNRSITDVFEPGSTMKIFTAASLLQEKIKKKDDIVFCENGYYKVYDRPFRDTQKHAWLSFQKVIEKSSNIGMIKLSEELPSRVLFRYLKNFGFGATVNGNLIGEASGMLENPANWSGVSKASISIGYEIGVTTLQLASAYAAVVNGGYLYRPYVISHFQSRNGQIHSLNKPQVIRQIISPEVSKILKSMMGAAVERGTGKKAKLEKIRVGGKTGTARKNNRKLKSYYKNKYVSSFIGFAGYEHPKYICAIIIDDPKRNRYGSDVAAPVFRKIINRIYHFDESRKQNKTQNHQAINPLVEKIEALPALTGFKTASAVSLLDEKGIDYRIRGNGSIVKEVVIEDDEMILISGTDLIQYKKVPRLTGLTLREALARIDLAQYKVQLVGSRSGIVVKQNLKPGTKVNKRTELILNCK